MKDSKAPGIRKALTHWARPVFVFVVLPILAGLLAWWLLVGRQ